MTIYMVVGAVLVIFAGFIGNSDEQVGRTTGRPPTTMAYNYAAANDLISGWNDCSDCDYCIARNRTVKCFFVIHNVNWSDARTYCAKWNGELATIRSDLETRFLNRTKSILGVQRNAWIGLRWRAPLNLWLWTDDVPIKNNYEYNLFAPGEPAEGGTCVEFIAGNFYNDYLGYYTGYWSGVDCSLTRDAICQYTKRVL